MTKARLTALLEEVERRYRQYGDRMQVMVTSFESALGRAGAASPYTSLVRTHVSSRFRALRHTLAHLLHLTCHALGHDISTVPILNLKGDHPRLRVLDQRIRHHSLLQQLCLLSPQQQYHSWRPHRGLPERSVAVLRGWLFEHFLHPYPKDSEKMMLARLTGLTRRQVSNWFINARVRLWKPMVEQMCEEEEWEEELETEASSLVDHLPKSISDADVDVAQYRPGHFSMPCLYYMTSQTHVQPKDGHGGLPPEHQDHFLPPSVDVAGSTVLMKQGVSLTLALEHSPSAQLSTTSGYPTHYHQLQSGPGDRNGYNNSAFAWPC